MVPKLAIELFKPHYDDSMASAMHAVMQSGQIAHGRHVAELETALAMASGVPHFVAVSEAAAALELALQVSGLAWGDEVLTTSYACLSSIAPIALTGMKPIWVELDQSTGTMDPEDLKRKITKRSRAVLVVHTAGYPARVAEIAEIARTHNLIVIEDCNSAWGARYANQPLGSWGDCAIFSFYPNRQLGGVDGAALACKNPQHAEAAKRLRRFGIDANSFRRADGEINSESEIALLGRAQTMNNLCAAALIAQLPGHAARERTVQHNAETWHQALVGANGIEPVRIPSEGHGAYWAFLVLCEDRSQRDTRMHRLKAAGVQCSILHTRIDRYAAFGGAASLPATDAFVDRVLALPCGWWVTTEQIELMAALLLKRES